MMRTFHIVVTLLMLMLFSNNQQMVEADDTPESRESSYDDRYFDDYYSRYDDDYYNYYIACPRDSCPDGWFCDYDYWDYGYCYPCPRDCDYLEGYLYDIGVTDCREECFNNGSNNENTCFSGNMEVVVQGKGTVPMEALQVGDYVKTGNGEGYERVYAFAHRVPNKYTEFVQLHTKVGTPLEMTGEHLVFVDGKANPVRAASIKVGDRLQASASDAIVEKITSVTRNGIYSPLTSSGTIQVNGITASNYISFQKENNEYVEFEGGIEIPLSHHDLAHRAMTPFRFYCTTLAICDVNDAKTGMPVYVSKGIDLIEWSQQQHIAVQMLIWASFRMLLLASILMTCAVFMIPIYMLSESSIFQMQRVISRISTIGASLNKKMKKEN